MQQAHCLYAPQPRHVTASHSQAREQVGFFLHTPFPSSEYYRTLPYREQLLRGILKADLIGFHTYDYARHFISSCTRILGLEGTPYGVEETGSLIRVAAFPIGITPHKFTAALKEEEVVKHVEFLKRRCALRAFVNAASDLAARHSTERCLALAICGAVLAAQPTLR